MKEGMKMSSGSYLHENRQRKNKKHISRDSYEKRIWSQGDEKPEESLCQSVEKKITIRLDNGTIEYFKKLAEETGFSYQALINLYLRDCAENHKKLKVEWIESRQ